MCVNRVISSDRDFLRKEEAKLQHGIVTHGQWSVFAYVFADRTAASILHKNIDSMNGSHDVVAVDDVLVFDLRKNGQFAF